MTERNQIGGHSNESLRFVQLSDLHLSSLGVPNPFQLVNKRILGYLSWLRRRRHTHQRWVLDLALQEFQQLNIDHYAITGDLTHIGLETEFLQAKQWLQQLGTPENVTVIPGNHDLYVNEQWSKSFIHWENYLIGDISHQQISRQQNNALMCLNQLYPRVIIRKNTAFVCVNSIFNAPWFRATGRLLPQQLQRLTSILQSSELDNYCKILLIHHPITLTNTPLRKCLLNHQDLTSILRIHPVDLVLHGHGHHSCCEFIYTKQGSKIPIIGISSSSSISQKAGYQAEFLLFQVNKNNQSWKISKRSYTLDTNSNSFIASEPQQIQQQ